MKKFLFILMIIPVMVIGKSTKTVKTDNNILISNSSQTTNFPNFYQVLSVSNVTVSSTGSGYGSVAINNNVLTGSFGGAWPSGKQLKTDSAVLNFGISPSLPNMELGSINSSSMAPSPTGYNLRIENNSLIIYSTGAPINLLSCNFSFSINLNCVEENGTILDASTKWYLDNDLDGLGDPAVFVVQCTKPSGNYVLDNSDLCPAIYGSVSNCSQLSIIPQDKNFIKTTHYQEATIDGINNLNNNPITDEQKLVNITYYDGLGRPIQKIASKHSASGRDVITHIEYDQYGRQVKNYLPYVSTNDNMMFDHNAKVNTLNFYNNPTVAITGNLNFEATNFPYTEKLIEDSSLNRVLKQASPGEDWKLPTSSSSIDHTIKFGYNTNVENEVRKFKVVFNSGTTENHKLEVNGFYGANQLYKSIIKDENWVPIDGLNKTKQEFKDKEGRIILIRTFNNSEPHDTYYVYDVYGNLSYVVPPTGSDAIDETYETHSTIVKNYPWTSLVVIDGTLAEEYNKLFSEYKNELIANADLYSKYGGQGGFSILKNNNNDLALTINIETNQAIELKNGIIASLKELGSFKDAELGRIKSADYDYIFSVKDNSLCVNGKGKISSINTSFVGNTKLIYDTNYPWAAIVDINPKLAEQYLAEYNEVKNEVILTTNIENEFGATGGININVDENDIVSLEFKLSSTTPLKLKTGLVLPLKMERRISDRELFLIENNNARYLFSIKENCLYIEGEGSLTYAYKKAIVSPPPVMAIPKDIVEGLFYIYNYDYRDRLIEKKIPGKGWEYLVYDRLDREALTQDNNLRLNNRWLFTKYDVFNRPIFSGQFVYNSPSSNINTDLRRELQTLINNNYTVLSESRTVNTFQSGNANINYTNTLFPNANNSGFQVFRVNYYDDYTFAFISVPVSSANNITITNAKKSLSTCELSRVLDTNEWISNIKVYDSKDRLCATRTDNTYLQTVDVKQLYLDFSGRINQCITTHNKVGVISNLITVDKFYFDKLSRILKQTQKIGSQPEELIYFNKFDELGALIKKKVGGIAPATSVDFNGVTTSLQTIDYAYNVRGWLRKINDPDNNLTDDLFAFKINYNTTSLSGSTSLYNGNIAETSWRTINDNKPRNYKYTYDDLNRLIQADYVGNYQLTANTTQTENYTEGNLAYDKNGNIMHLERYGLKSTGNIIDVIDNINYKYFPRSNKLRQVYDSSTEPAGFKDDANLADDYSYDMNGNLKTDTNKGITNIEYNHLNLPTKIVFNNLDPLYSSHPKAIEYVYDATGVKLSKKVTVDLTIITVTQYSGNYIYENNQLQYFSQPEGYVAKNGSSFSYVYQHKDHVGNVRLSYKKNGSNIELVEENNYYPFGLKHQGYNTVVSPSGNSVAQKKKYNGKEFQDELDFDMYDYGARNYDPAIARWTSIDPLAEKSRRFSPYVYALNNPVFFIDPDGMEATGADGMTNDEWLMDRKGRFSSALEDLLYGNGNTKNKSTPKITKQWVSMVFFLNETDGPDPDDIGEVWISIEVLVSTIEDSKGNKTTILTFDTENIRVNKKGKESGKGYGVDLNVRVIDTKGNFRLAVSISEGSYTEVSAFNLGLDLGVDVKGASVGVNGGYSSSSSQENQGGTASFVWDCNLSFNAESTSYILISKKDQYFNLGIEYLNEININNEVGDSEYYWSKPVINLIEPIKK